MIDPIQIVPLVPLILVAFGIAYVITGSEIGYPIRFFFCVITKWMRLKFLWGLVRCPSCNAWWAGGILAYACGYPWDWALQAAFASCGVTAYIQHRLGGDGIAAAEKFEKLFEKPREGEEKDNGKASKKTR